MKIWDLGFRALEDFKRSLAARSAKNRRRRRTHQRGLAFESLEPRYALSGVSGSVFSVVDGHSYALPGVLISIVGRDQQNNVIASASVRTGTGGTYSFEGLPAGTYAITETQPSQIADGNSVVGSLGGTAGTNTVTNISLGEGVNATGYNFREGGFAVVSVNLFLSSTPALGDHLANTSSSSTTPPAVAITTVPNPIISANSGNLSVSGTGKAGATVSVVVTDGTKTSAARTATVAANGTWTINGLNANQLANGNVQYKATITDSSGATATSTLNGTKNATDPLVDITSAPDPINLTNQQNVSVSGTAQVGSKVSVVITDGANTTTAVVVNTAANGTWSVSGIDARGLKDGSITYRVTMTDNAGQTFTDTLAGTKTTVLITLATNPVGEDDETNASAQGTGQVGATISVVVTNGTTTTVARTTTVLANGTWSVSGIDLSGLADGPITYIATATDGANNTDESRLTASKDSLAPAIDLTSVTTNIGLSNHRSTTASGTGEAGSTVSVVVSDGTTTTSPRTVTVAANGTWTVTGIDTSTLKDGTLTYTATATDAAGNTSADSLTSTKSTLQIGSVTDPITSATGTNATASGTGQVGATVSVVVTNGSVTSTARTTTVAANGTWSVSGINVNQLANGTVTYRVTITDNSGNSATVTKTATKNVTDPLVDITEASTPITLANQHSVSVSGKAQVGSTVKVEVTDGTTTTTAVTTVPAANGSWSVSGIDVSALKDGSITYRVTMTDVDDHTFTDTLATTKATITLTSVTNPIDEDDETNSSAQGTGQVGATISVVATDGATTTTARTTTVNANGSWSVSGIDVSGLADGPITFIATASDGLGNTDESQLIATKDSVDPFVDLTNVTSPIRLNNYFATTASGTGEVGTTISVVASDGTTTTAARTATVQANGTWTVSGINTTGLKDGTITYTATATDTGGNTAMDTLTSIKTTVVLDSATNPINIANHTSTTVSGTGQVGATISLVATDGTTTTAARTTTVAANGTWSITGFDTSTLKDGTITFTATANDGSGNTATSTRTSTKTTVLISSATNPINANNQNSTTVSGTGQVGATISVTATDGVTTTAALTATVAANGTWSVTGINVSGLNNGTITYTATADDGAGHTATATRTSTKSNAAATPFAEDDTYNLSLGATLTTTAANGVLSNDTGGATNAILISGPSHGSITLNANGTFSYTQTSYGFDQFVYQVTNSSGQTDQATVTIQIPGLPRLPDGAVITTLPSGLQYYDFTVGTGASPAATDTVTVDYAGYLPNGTNFQSNDNINFSLSGVIEGFSEGIQGMKVGGVRRLIIPPDLGYGPGGNPGAGIGGTDTIFFDVTLDAIV